MSATAVTSTPATSATTQVRAWAGLAALVTATFAYTVLEAWIAPALPVIQEHVHASNTSLPWVFAPMLICAAVSTTLAGRLGDLFGLRPVLLTVLSILCTGVALAAVATSIELLAVGQAMQGLGMGSIPLSVAILRNMFPQSRISMAIGIYVGASAIGNAVGFILPGYVLRTLSYGWLFWLPLVVIGLSTLVAWSCLPSGSRRAGQSVDWIGALVLALGLTALVLAITVAPALGWLSVPTLALFGVAVALLAGWVVIETRSRQPLIAMSLLRQKNVWLTGFISLAIGFGIFSSMVLVPMLAALPRVDDLGFGATTTQVGVLLLPLGAAGVLVGPMSGVLDHKIGARASVQLGMLILTIGSLGLVFMHAEQWQILVAISIIGIGVFLALTASINLITGSVAAEDVGFAASLPLTAKSIGGSLGAQIGVSVLASQTVVATGRPLDAGFTISFAIATIVALGGLAMSLALPNAPKVPPRQ
ncbi:MFS transporter [Micromonospora sp. NPDC050495]|uniref:MFS transporter n=1 Tax=Micromonospora sp. NPDC050495 TaxID=3154936 RepID=UPI0033C9A8E5